MRSLCRKWRAMCGKSWTTAGAMTTRPFPPIANWWKPACYNLSQLGELCKVADDSFTAAHPEIPWREMYGLRNRIVHDYEGVNLKLVWEIIQGDLPELEKAINKLL